MKKIFNKFIILFMFLSIFTSNCIAETKEEQKDMYREAIAFYILGSYEEDEEEAIEDFEDAIVLFNKLLKMDYIAEGEIWTFKGLTLNELEEYEEAIEAFNNAIELDSGYNSNYEFRSLRDLDSEFVLIYTGKGRAFFGLRRYEEAIEEFDLALEINPEFELAWRYKGSAHLALDELDKAINAFDRVLDIDSDDKIAKLGKEIAIIEKEKSTPTSTKIQTKNNIPTLLPSPIPSPTLPTTPKPIPSPTPSPTLTTTPSPDFKAVFAIGLLTAIYFLIRRK
jgi:tetratricopeptide (TPR) repeat protein